MKKCVISFADGIYKNGLRRLENSIRDTNPDLDILFWYDTLPPNSPTHDKAPCAFKIFAFLEAKRQGYDLALWIDATGIVIKSLDKIFDEIAKNNYYLFSTFSVPIGKWSSDITLQEFGIKREEAMKIPELLSFSLGLNLNSPITNEFLNICKYKALNSYAFRGASEQIPLKETLSNNNCVISKDLNVKGHRWEQTVISLVAYKLKMRQNIFGIFDLIGYAKQGSQYAKIIPYTTYIVQNRDIKMNEYLADIKTWFKDKTVFYPIMCFVYTLGHHIKNFIRIKTNKKFDTKLMKI